MDEDDQRRRDLDPADLDEVRRRVVDPVLAELFEPGELTEVQLSASHPPGWYQAYGGSDDGLWLNLAAGSEFFTHPVAKAGFWLDDAEWVAADLADKLAEWICESSFGWGQWRSLPDGWSPPPPSPGRSTLSIHFADDDGELPLWAGGAPAPWLEARLSHALVADLRAWQALGSQLAEETETAETGVEPPAPERGVSMTEQYLTDEQWRARESEAQQALTLARAARREWIEALEPLRDELVERLRAELGPDYTVAAPPRVI